MQPETNVSRVLAYLRANPGGMTTDEASSVGLTEDQVSVVLCALLAQKRCAWLPAPKGRAQMRKRYFALETAPEGAFVGPKRTARSAIPVKRERGTKLAADAPVLSRPVKVTICPSGKDHRFTPASEPPLFSALRLGSYLHSGTAIERAYAAASVPEESLPPALRGGALETF